MTKSMRFEHIVFDCDGVLVDSESLSMEADVRLLKEYGVSAKGSDLMARFVGRTCEIMWQELADQHKLPLPADFKNWYEDRMTRIYRDELQIVTDVQAMLAALPIAASCASNSTRRMLRLKLDVTGLAPIFGDRAYSIDDVANPKPAPDLYLHAAHTAGADPQRCVAVEDSRAGATAAVAAGMTVLGFIGTHHDQIKAAAALRAAGVVHVFDSMSELPALLDDLGRQSSVA